MPVIHSRLTDDELNELAKKFNSDLEKYPKHLQLKKNIKTAVDEYDVIVFDNGSCEYSIYLFDTDDYLLGFWYGHGDSIVACVRSAIENHESVYYTPRNEFNRWDGDLTKL